MAEGHPALVHEVANGGWWWQERPSARATAQNGRHRHGRRWEARAPADLRGQRSEGCTIPSYRGGRPSNPNPLFSSNQRGDGRNPKSTHLHLHLTHAIKMTNYWQEARLALLAPPIGRMVQPELGSADLPANPHPPARGALARDAEGRSPSRARATPCSINTGPLRPPLRSLRVSSLPRAEAILPLCLPQPSASPPLSLLRVALSHRRRHERAAQRLPRGVH